MCAIVLVFTVDEIYENKIIGVIVGAGLKRVVFSLTSPYLTVAELFLNS